MTDEQRLQMITDQLILVRDNLFRGMSKSIQKLQARSINEVLELENFTQSPQRTEQKSVAVHQFRKRGCSDWYDGNPDHTDGCGPYEARTLYTSTPARHGWTTQQIAGMARLKEAQDKKLSQRTWVGLTDEEMQDLWDRYAHMEMMRAIEAKLKEKNT
ncbi:hypothetical protein UFOVP252_43 [uncultured Caudovirales phage]|uniref:Uncharacterized protein n=1 Tax=uncultured Caudovirales phage TaxID=2100421 RepID=A0A6J5LG22_9CAUD|nr:hypothetical protein UFOVP252_43 [uncultured Caudovirales phage]